MANTLEQEWQNCFSMLSELEKRSVLLMLKTFVQGKSANENTQLLHQYNLEIDEALAKVEEGNFITQSDMENQASKW